MSSIYERTSVEKALVYGSLSDARSTLRVCLRICSTLSAAAGDFGHLYAELDSWKLQGRDERAIQ